MKLLAQVGILNNPYGPSGFNVSAYTSATPGYGLFLILNNLIKFVIILAGIYAFWNFLTAGYQFMSAGGDPKNISKASAKILHSVMGLLVVVSSFIIAGILGLLLYNDPVALLSPQIFTP